MDFIHQTKPHWYQAKADILFLQVVLSYILETSGLQKKGWEFSISFTLLFLGMQIQQLYREIIYLLNCWDLVLNFIDSKFSINCMQNLVTLISCPSAIHQSNNNSLFACKIGYPANAKGFLYILTARSSIPEDENLHIFNSYLQICKWVLDIVFCYMTLF